MKKVSVITVNFNQPSVTEALLDSIIRYNHYQNMEVIVADNGSQINPLPLWINKYPNIRFIRSEVNLGFAGGNNFAVRQADGDYLFFVNNDTEFREGLVEKLAKILEEHPEAGMVSPKIRFYHEPRIIQYAGFTPMNFYTCRNRCIGEYEEDKGQYDHSTGPTGFIHGAAMMVRRETIRKAGLMAENFFLYYEEMDWCERIRRAGFQSWVEPQALIYHKESVSVGKRSPLKEYFMNRNRILFIRRNASLPAKIFFFLHFFILVIPRNLLKYADENRTDLISSLFKAIWWNFTHKKDSDELGYPINIIR